MSDRGDPERGAGGRRAGAQVMDLEGQQQDTAPVALDGPVALPAVLGAEEISALAAIRRRRQLLRASVFQRRTQALMNLTYALQHQPTPERPRAVAAQHAERRYLRVVSWNIQRGIQIDGIQTFIQQHAVLRELDILLLNEVDVGMARSGNRNVAAELAARLGFGFVFGNSYLCLDSGDPRDGSPQGSNRESLHGNAILSRYPLRCAENFTIQISKDKFHSGEKRLGHKKALWAEVATPMGPLPVVVVHLDSYASAAQRGEQLEDVLDKIEQRGLSDRALIGGDFNTTTYDAGTAGQLCLNLVRKVARGGFPHGIYHYLHPYEIYERPVFQQLHGRGFEYRSLNDMHAGTTRYEVGSFDSESKVREQLPGLAVKILRWKLRPWGGVAPLKLDWFAARGIRAAEDRRAPGSVAPTVISKPTVAGVPLSDHDPIVVDVEF